MNFKFFFDFVFYRNRRKEEEEEAKGARQKGLCVAFIGFMVSEMKFNWILTFAAFTNQIFQSNFCQLFEILTIFCILITHKSHSLWAFRKQQKYSMIEWLKINIFPAHLCAEWTRSVQCEAF